MIKVNKIKDGPATYNLINFDYFHISHNRKNYLNEDEFKNKIWNLHFVRHKIPYFVLDNLEINYSTSLKGGGNNYILDSDFPYSAYMSQSVHYNTYTFNPSDLETGYIMHFSSFLRFINFMLPPIEGEVIDIANDVLYYEDPFKLSIICSYNIYSNIYAFHEGPMRKTSNPEYEWIAASLNDGLIYEEELKHYKQKII